MCFTGRPVRSDATAVAIVMPALGPSFGMAPGRDVEVERAVLERSSSMPSCDASARTEESAICADSFITSPSWPVRTSLSPSLWDVASMKRTSPPVAVAARPVATPGTAVRSATSR